MNDIFDYIGPLWQMAGYPLIALLCAALAAIGPTLWKLFAQFWTLRKQRILKRDLFPFYTQLEAQQATQYYVDTKCQQVAPSKDEEPRLDDHKALKQSGLTFFLKKGFHPQKEDCQFYIILADSGMGKTTFLLNLYLHYLNQFIRPQQYDIKIFPLAFPEVDAKITAVENKGQTILLLDAFDEDMQAVQDYRARLDRLIALTKEFREVVITCRTQFFPSEYEEPRETGVMRYGGEGGEQTFYKFYLSPFDDADIRTYLRKRFPWWQRDKRRKAQTIVKHSPNLMVRPMLLQHIEDLLQDGKTYGSSYAVYAELIDRWIQRESRKVGAKRREDYAKELYQFTREIALDLYQRRAERGGALLISGAEIRPFADKHGIKLSDMEMKSKSLLNRNAQGYYKFSHKSILEYFLAEEAFFKKDFRRTFDFRGMSQANAFFDAMVWEKSTVPLFAQGELEGQYAVADGKPRILTPLPEKVLVTITSLTLPQCDEDTLLAVNRLPALKRLEVTAGRPAAILKATLRDRPLPVSDNTFRTVFGLDKHSRPRAYVANQYDDRGDVVVDHATGLMWQKRGSPERMPFDRTAAHIQTLNAEKLAGFNGWRLPTIPELMSLLEPEPKNGGLYIDHVFDSTQSWCWSSDTRQTKGEGSPSSAWVVYFLDGHVYWVYFGNYYYVRAVRSWQ